MANNNDQLFNAALAAFVGAGLTAAITDGVQADYDNISAAGAVFAAAVDADIPADGTLVSPVTAATLKKVNALQSICQQVMAGRASLSTVSSTYTVTAAAIAAAYKSVVAHLA